MMVLKWMEEVQLVDGYVRSCLYDLPRGTFSLVDSQIKSLIDRIEGQTLDNLLHHLDSNEREWLEHFLQSEYLFEVPQVTFSLFPRPLLKWENSSIVYSAVLSDSNEIAATLKLLERYGCKHLWINCQTFNSAKKLLTDHFTPTFVLSIDLCILHPTERSDYAAIIKQFPVINKVYVRDLEVNNSREMNDQILPLHSKEEGTPIFIVNLPIFSESIEYNTYFNRKLHLENGAGGLTPPIVISDIMDRPPAIWFSSKEKTNVCSDCEFRRMCIDKRIPTQQSEGSKWYHTTECNYNPYIAKWQREEGYRTLAECGVVSNENEFSVDHERIAAINKELWGE